MEDVQALVGQKRTLLQSRGYQIIKIWECEWQALKTSDQDMADFVANLRLQPLLDPQEAFYNGRTNG